jgi:hypothetical protein
MEPQNKKELSVEERLGLLEDAFESIVSGDRSEQALDKVKAWYKAYKERMRKAQMDNALREMIDEVGNDPWFALRDGKLPQMEQGCSYHKCNHTRIVKPDDVKGMTDEELMAEECWCCSLSCQVRWAAWENLLQEWPKREAGQIPEAEWKRMVREAETAHLRLPH